MTGDTIAPAAGAQATVRKLLTPHPMKTRAGVWLIRNFWGPKGGLNTGGGGGIRVGVSRYRVFFGLCSIVCCLAFSVMTMMSLTCWASQMVKACLMELSLWLGELTFKKLRVTS